MYSKLRGVKVFEVELIRRGKPLTLFYTIE